MAGRINVPRYNEKGEKWCGGCSQYKPMSEYGSSAAKYPAQRCRACSTNWRRRNKKSVDNKRFKRDYGISGDDYLELLAAQNGVCAICGEPETQTKKKHGTKSLLSVDHDHDTKKVRGLLCADCNLSVGWFEKIRANIPKIEAYLSDKNFIKGR